MLATVQSPLSPVFWIAWSPLMIRLTRTRVFCGLALLILSQSTGCAIYLAKSEIDFQKAVDFAGVRTVCVDTQNGSIDVQCDPARKDVDIQATKFSRGVTAEDARQHA